MSCLQRPLPLRGADRAAEVLGGDDVGRVDAPEVGELHAPLLEVDRAVAPVGHDDVAALPGHLVVRVHALGRPHPLDRSPLRGTLRPFGLTAGRSAWVVRPAGWSAPVISHQPPVGVGVRHAGRTCRFVRSGIPCPPVTRDLGPRLPQRGDLPLEVVQRLKRLARSRRPQPSCRTVDVTAPVKSKRPRSAARSRAGSAEPARITASPTGTLMNSQHRQESQSVSMPPSTRPTLPPPPATAL